MTMKSKTLSISINRALDEVYGFVSNPENLPKWAKALCRSVRESNGDWIVETPQGGMKIRFADLNDFGVLDHSVEVTPGVQVYVPMRVVRNGSGSEVIFTVFRQEGMSDDKFDEDVHLVEGDLLNLKRALEG